MVLYKLFDTAAEAKENVSNGQPIEPDGDPCPPQTQPTVDIVCWYTVESHKGLAMFSHTEKDNLSFFISRWVSNAEPRLRGEMSTETAEPQDWTTLKANWTRLVTAK